MKESKTRIDKLFQILSCYLILGAAIFTAYGQTGKLTMIFDGQAENKAFEVTKAEEQFIEKEVMKKQSVIKKNSRLSCDEDSFGVNGVVSGSFTRPKSLQKAYLYELCRSGRSFGIGGIVVVENSKIVSHYIYGENGLNSDIAALADINQNGLSEILLIGSWTGQGYTMGAVEIIEITPSGIKSFGIANTYEDNYGVGNAAKSSGKAYKVFAQRGKVPVYFRETYTQKSFAEKWIMAKKSQKFSLRKDYIPVYNKIS